MPIQIIALLRGITVWRLCEKDWKCLIPYYASDLLHKIKMPLLRGHAVQWFLRKNDREEKSKVMLGWKSIKGK